MKSHDNFLIEHERLLNFYKVTMFSYEQTSSMVHMWKKDKTSFNTIGLEFVEPDFYINKKKERLSNQKNLSEIVLIRLVSALEVFLIDLIRDVFLNTKEPFKKQDILLQFTQAELLSIDSPSLIFNKVISKELRRLSSGGLEEIIKYYKRHFGIELGNFSPGKSKMEEYHERRHLLVHRLGKTDEQYRKKYNYNHPTITISEKYLYECFNDFKDFAKLVNTQIKYKVNQIVYSSDSKPKIIEAKSNVSISLLKSNLDFLKPSFEFWVGDEFTMFSAILVEKSETDKNILELTLSGTERQIEGYKKILQTASKNKEIQLNRFKTKVNYQEPAKPLFLNEEMINLIQRELPVQPWETGIHKIVATKLGYSNKLVSIAIQQLIGKGVFKNQINGSILKTN